MFKSLVLPVAFLLITSSSKANELDEIKANWERTKVDVPFLITKVNNINCNLTESRFLGCIKSINELLSLSSTEGSPRYLLSRFNQISYIERLTKAKNNAISFELYKDFEGYGIYKYASNGDLSEAISHREESLLNAYRRILKAEKVWHDSWIEFFKSPNVKHVDFEGIIKWIQSSVLPEKHAFIVAQAYNQYLVNGEDAHAHISPRIMEDKEQSESTEGFVGIGVLISKFPGSKKIVITQVYDGFPAQKAGLMPNDVITMVEGKDISGIPMDRIMPIIRGPVGSKLKLSVSRNNSVLSFTIERKNISLPNVGFRKIQLKPKSQDLAGYIKIQSFNVFGVCADVKSALKTFNKDKNVKGIILDVRENPGGLVTETQCIQGLFTGPRKSVMATLPTYIDPRMGVYEQSEALFTSTEQVTALPMVVLINASSASASELISGSLQGHGRAVIVGERSWGKGTVLAQRNFKQEGIKDVVKTETIAMFFILSQFKKEAHTNQSVGIAPDIEAYMVPHPSKIHKFALREADTLPISLPTPEKDSPPRNPEVKARIEKCLQETGIAEKRYSTVDPTVGKDYQLLVGLDSLNCEIKKQ